MKLGAFLLGGIAGAAAVMLIRKQSMASMAGGVSRMMKSWNGSKRDTQGKALSLLFGRGGEAAADSGQSGHSASHAKTSQAPEAEESGIGQIAQIVSEDEGVKKEINEILEQNDQPRL